jgi:4-hydroxythreonine-4-phosphate dehydrogenase
MPPMPPDTKPITIAITMGEPAGIGIEIITKALSCKHFDNIQFIIIGDKNLFDIPESSRIKFHHIDFGNSVDIGICKIDYADKILEIIDIGVDYCLKNRADALVTAPINKDTIHAINPDFFGHTDYISDIILRVTQKYYRPVMMLACPELRAVPLTVHIPLCDVTKTITTEMIIQTVTIIDTALKDDYNIANPRIKIAGLNPHAGDNGIMGHEEITILMPAIAVLRDRGITISDPTSADIMFHAFARQGYDVAVCMYHDQALIPVKTLGFDVGVNVTLGLPIIRTSPDHGTALDIAGTNKASPNAMIAAINEAIMLCQNRFKKRLGKNVIF